MIFIVRTFDEKMSVPDLRIIRARATPSAEARDLFCVGDDDAVDKLRADGWSVVLLHDGWYADDQGGGIAVWGAGRHWEVRESMFNVIDHD